MKITLCYTVYMGYIGMCHHEGYGFQAVGDRVYKSESRIQYHLLGN